VSPVTTSTFRERKRQGEKIAMLTAYDFPTARLLDEAGVDCILVGDSLGMVVMGHQDTLSVTMDDMVHHTRIVTRGVQRAFVVADMPFLSYQITPEEALRNAGRLVSEAGAKAVKLEGSAEKFGAAIRNILNAGIPVMGHLGLTPQSVHQFGGYRVQGRTPEEHARILRESQGLEEAGCFAVVLECVPPDLAEEVTRSLRIPTIGIGAGAGCDGQVLVIHDMLGWGTTKFSKTFADVRGAIGSAVQEYVAEVRAGQFPGAEHTYNASPKPEPKP
jgi:3-methyl-2-oxobutanoate hydroxymethyltransferase